MRLFRLHDPVADVNQWVLLAIQGGPGTRAAQLIRVPDCHFDSPLHAVSRTFFGVAPIRFSQLYPVAPISLRTHDVKAMGFP
jgi:hypothetical protein